MYNLNFSTKSGGYFGRIFYGIAIIGTGMLTVYNNSLPYWLLPPENFRFLRYFILVTGILLILTGGCLVFKKLARPVSLLFGAVLLLIFCFLFVPYEFLTDSNYKHLSEWENAEKELSFASGAFVLVGCFSDHTAIPRNRFSGMLIPFGSILYSIPIISFGILHLMYAKDVSTMVPSWIPVPLFWTYFAGVALIGSGISIILRIRTGFIAALLGLMIFIWFITLHIPRVINAPVADRGDEMISAFLALAYSGIAFIISGATKKFV
jgi:uncharacterized membrane protein YphA (DoxX/SURF4 family)